MLCQLACVRVFVCVCVCVCVCEVAIMLSSDVWHRHWRTHSERKEGEISEVNNGCNSRATYVGVVGAGRLATAAAALSAGFGSCSHLTCVAGPYLRGGH